MGRFRLVDDKEGGDKLVIITAAGLAFAKEHPDVQAAVEALDTAIRRAGTSIGVALGGTGAHQASA